MKNGDLSRFYPISELNEKDFVRLNADGKIDSELLPDIASYHAFPEAWPTSSSTTTKAFCDVVNADTNAVVGNAYLGGASFSDLPFEGNGDIVVEIMQGPNNSKSIHLICTSGNIAPYRWEYTYWNNGSNVSGWIGYATNNVATTTSAGLMPQLESETVATQSQTTKFLREDGSWSAPSYSAAGMANPMTAAGDLIVGGADGEPAKLAAGTLGQVLKIGNNGPEWSSDAVHVHYIRFIVNSAINKPNMALVVVCNEPQFASFTSLCSYFYSNGFTDGTKLVPVACNEENIFSAYMFGFSSAGGCTIAGMAWNGSAITRTSLGVSASGITNFSDTVVL